MQTILTSTYQLRLPIIMAPMFLVSNEEMVVAAMRAGIMGTFPTLNFREKDQLNTVLTNLNKYEKPYGVNIIVQKTNSRYKEHLAICIEKKVPFYITSLGNPKEVIEKAHEYGAKVYCDVTNLKHAQKCYEAGADGFIAVCQGAGGHAGPFPSSVLVPLLKKQYPTTPIIIAGGIANGQGIVSSIALGASGVSMGTRFIATTEAKVSQEYKQAIVDSKMEDIVLTERISGTPCAIINTPYAQKIGLQQNKIERWLNSHPKTKKYFKLYVQYLGMKKLEKAIQPGNYNNLWSAGQSVALIDKISSIETIVDELEQEIENTIKLF